jgi:hypothetical protein
MMCMRVARWTQRNHVRLIVRRVDSPFPDVVKLSPAIQASGVDAFTSGFRD